MRKMHKPIVAGLLLAILAVSALTAALAKNEATTYAYIPDRSVYFYDVSGDYAWASREVDALSLSGVIRGNGSYLFEPAQHITRADFIVMLDRAYGMSEALAAGEITDKGTFGDVDETAYYAQSVAAAKAWGIATGNDDNLFYPTRNMTRQDAVVFIARTLEHTDTTLREASISEFSDAANVASYAVDAFETMFGAKIVNGSGASIKPDSMVTRAELAVMLYRATHLSETKTGAVYENRPDIVNVCIGEQIYGDVLIENYDAAISYTGLFLLMSSQETQGSISVKLGEGRAFDGKAQVSGDHVIVKIPTQENPNATQTFALSEACVAIDVSPYHRMEKPVSTSTEYPYCVPVIEDGVVTVIYYQAA